MTEGSNLRIHGSFVFLLARWIFRLRSNLLLAFLEAEILFLVHFPVVTVIAGITFCPLPACLAALSFVDSQRVRKRLSSRKVTH